MDQTVHVYVWWLRLVEFYLLAQVIWNARKGIQLARQIEWGWWLDDIARGKGWS